MAKQPLPRHKTPAPVSKPSDEAAPVSKRHLSRQAALQALTSLLLHPEQDAQTCLEYIHKHWATALNNTQFFEDLVHGVTRHAEAIDQKIAELAPQFPVTKMDPVERTILRLGIFEILHYETPTPVAINEAVELAKEFGDDTAAKLINGVLSNVEAKK